MVTLAEALVLSARRLSGATTDRAARAERTGSNRGSSTRRWATANAAMKKGNAVKCGWRSACRNVKNGNSLIVSPLAMTRDACQ